MSLCLAENRDVPLATLFTLNTQIKIQFEWLFRKINQNATLFPDCLTKNFTEWLIQLNN